MGVLRRVFNRRTMRHKTPRTRLDDSANAAFQNFDGQPHLSIKQKSVVLLKSLASELGLTPSARSKVAAVPTKQDDPYVELKKRREARLADAKKRVETKKVKNKE